MEEPEECLCGVPTPPVARPLRSCWGNVLRSEEEESEAERLEVEYLLLAQDFGDFVFLLAGFGPLQAALLKVFESGGHGRALHRYRRAAAVLQERKNGCKRDQSLETITAASETQPVPARHT